MPGTLELISRNSTKILRGDRGQKGDKGDYGPDGNPGRYGSAGQPGKFYSYGCSSLCHQLITTQLKCVDFFL
jgi:hypothetical protein